MLAVILLVAAGLRVWAPWDDVFPFDFAQGRRLDAREFSRDRCVVPRPSRREPGPQFPSPHHGRSLCRAGRPVRRGRAAARHHHRDGRVRHTRPRRLDRRTSSAIAALVPAIVGVLAVAAVWALATIAFDRRAGLIAGLLAAVLPGHFLDRTLVGFVDHHALEVLLSMATLACIAYGSAIGAGVCLGLYLLAWASGSYFVFILAVWLVTDGDRLCPRIARPQRDSPRSPPRSRSRSWWRFRIRGSSDTTPRSRRLRGCCWRPSS